MSICILLFYVIFIVLPISFIFLFIFLIFIYYFFISESFKLRSIEIINITNVSLKLFYLNL